MINDDIAFGILNGGKSSRMGSDKSLIKFKGITLAERIYRVCEKISENIYFMGHSSLPDSLKNCKIIKDSDKYYGPVKAFYSAINFEQDFVFFIAVDMPYVDESYINEVIEKGISSKCSIIPYNEESELIEPLCAMYTADDLRKIINYAEKYCVYSLNKIIKELDLQLDSIIYDKYKEIFKSWNKPIDIK